MAQDRNGHFLAVGMHVLIPCVVAEIRPGEDGPNCLVRSLEPVRPLQEGISIAINSRQVTIGELPIPVDKRDKET